MEALVAAWEDPSVPLGTFAEGAPDTEATRPRHAQLVPGKYAALLIHRHRITPEQA